MKAFRVDLTSFYYGVVLGDFLVAPVFEEFILIDDTPFVDYEAPLMTSPAIS
ncbi:MAG: hypothetical protein KJO12_01545 [Ignavibacteria bacterium]|nr:hypothetical protein [Ignavibacteria bacterium]